MQVQTLWIENRSDCLDSLTLMFLSFAYDLVQFFSNWDHRLISLLRCIFRVLCLLYVYFKLYCFHFSDSQEIGVVDGRWLQILWCSSH